MFHGIVNQDKMTSISVIEFPENIHESKIHIYMEPLYNELELYKDELIYLSLGGKSNERILTYKESFGVGQLNTNCLYQMIPSFLHNDSIQRECILKRKNEKYKCLCVIVDSFLPEELERNIQLINHNSHLHDVSNVKVYIVNCKMYTNLDETNEYKIVFLKSLLGEFCNELRLRNIYSDNFMMCNYIKFKHNNNSNYELRVRQAIEDVVKEKDYERSHYEWFGYSNSLNYLFYNFVYLNGEFDENVLSRLIVNVSRAFRDASREVSGKEKGEQIYCLDWKRLCLNIEIKEKIKCIMPITYITHYNTENPYTDLFNCTLYDIIS